MKLLNVSEKGLKSLISKNIICLLMVLFVVSTAFAQTAGELSEEQRAQMIKYNLDDIDLEEAPKILKFILGKPKINIEVNGNVYGFKIAGNQIKDFVEGGLDNPHYKIFISENALSEITNAEDRSAKIEELYINGDIKIEPQRIGAKIKFWLAKRFIKKLR
ncbi:hypothetical protein GOV06_00880 [Candidatus Woesearchaeota archaeon]|nr:hypothetical protein [Candidatus Woesearchaeota archaeon]